MRRSRCSNRSVSPSRTSPRRHTSSSAPSGTALVFASSSVARVTRRIEIPTLDDVRAAAARIAGTAIRTPLIRLHVDAPPTAIYLKLENLQPIGSFKLRGAANAIKRMPRERLADGVYTASAG